MGENGCEEEEWMLSNLVENEKITEDEEEEEEEALSLCDLPNKEEKQSKKESPGGGGGESQEDDDFDFCWWGGSSSLKESEMCTADEVFFQGQILPLRHSISSDGGSFPGSFKNNGGRCHSFRYTSGSSSRSSSLRSLRSSSSGSTSTSTTMTKTTTTTIHSKNYNNIKKQPTPQVQFSKVVSHANLINNNCTTRKSITLWTLFRAGLVSTPEIDFQDLKIRQNNTNNNNHKPFGSRNSSNDTRVRVKRNLKQRFSDKNMILFGNTCSCSVNDVRTVPPRTATVSRNSSAKEAHEDKNSETTKVMRKQAMSRRLRTFEWLKQLSLEGSAATTTL